jgi:hypothetical protein
VTCLAGVSFSTTNQLFFRPLPSVKKNTCTHTQILTACICAITLLMCLVKSYVDSNILPYVAKSPGTSSKRKQKQQGGKDAAQQPDGDKKKPGPWELLTASPRIMNLTLMVRVAVA